MSLRSLLNRLTGTPPTGTTHVLQHLPAWLLEDPKPADADGWWEIQPLACWLAGAPADNQPFVSGPADVSLYELKAFAAEALGCWVAITENYVEIADDRGRRRTREPAHFITPL